MWLEGEVWSVVFSPLLCWQRKLSSWVLTVFSWDATSSSLGIPGRLATLKVDRRHYKTLHHCLQAATVFLSVYNTFLVGLCACFYVCICMEANDLCQLSSSVTLCITFWGSVSHYTWNLPIWLGQLTNKLVRSSYATAWALELQVYASVPGFFIWMLGMKDRFPCLYGKHFINWLISLDPCILSYWIIILADMFSRLGWSYFQSIVLQFGKSLQEWIRVSSSETSLQVMGKLKKKKMYVC